jgi:hypothetical protein
MHRRFWILAVLLLMGLAPRGAAAQDATPSDAFVTPDPAECQVAPRTVDELGAFLATPSAGAAVASPEALPAGEPADDATTAAVTATIREITACANANAFLRMFALYSDAYLARSMASEDLNPDALALFATPIAPQAADARISIAIEAITTLPDGRASVVVTSRSPLGGNTESTSTYVLVKQDGRWLVDDIITPAAAG